MYPVRKGWALMFSSMLKTFQRYEASCNFFCIVLVERISNTDGFAVLYGCLPGRAVFGPSVETLFVCVKDGLTVVLTVYADGQNGPLTIIGKAKKPCSFSRHFDGSHDLELY